MERASLFMNDSRLLRSHHKIFVVSGTRLLLAP